MKIEISIYQAYSLFKEAIKNMPEEYAKKFFIIDKFDAIKKILSSSNNYFMLKTISFELEDADIIAIGRYADYDWSFQPAVPKNILIEIYHENKGEDDV